MAFSVILLDVIRCVLSMNLAFKTKTDVVREKLRQDIIGRRLKPGQRIVISEVAKDFGLSEIPVREAIRRLESEGLVEFTPHVGAVVSTIDENEFLEIYLIRIELEVLATRLAVSHIGEKELIALNRMIRDAGIAIKQEKHEKLGPLNKKFHMVIYQASPYRYLSRLITDLWEKFELTNCIFAFVPGRAIPSWHEHEKIVDAIRRKDADGAAELVREQKTRTMKALKGFLKEKKPFAETK